MDRSIYVFGTNKVKGIGFEEESELEDYIAEGIFKSENWRFRYPQSREADVIILSRDGELYGHFDIRGRVPTTDADRAALPGKKKVITYEVRDSYLYPHRVPLESLGVARVNWGAKISEEQFSFVLALAGDPFAIVKSTTSDPSLKHEWALRTVRQRLHQDEFRKRLVKAYGGKCAVTECGADEVLEGAHIVPWSQRGTHLASNGLLLRADIHCLFDCSSLAIEPGTHRVRLADYLLHSSYRELQGVRLRKPATPDAAPNFDALALRWKAFEAKHGPQE